MLNNMLSTVLNKTLTRLSFALPALLAATSASAHSGGHMEFSTAQVVSHMLASPYHTGMIVSALAAVAFIIWKVSHGSSSTNQSE
jgi:hypothetical protein